MTGEPDADAVKADLEKIKGLRKEFDGRTDYWSAHLADAADLRAVMAESHASAVNFFATLDREFIPAVEKPDKAAASAIAFGKLKSNYFEHRMAVAKVAALASEKSRQLGTAAAAEVQRRTILMLSVLIGGLVVLGLTSLGASRSLIRVVKSSASHLAAGACEVSTAATQVSSASQTLAEGASEQAASLEETSSSLEEMASMTRRNSENAQKANELAKQAREAADKGALDMQTMSAAMEAIKVSSDDIAKIIKTIDEIAFQTNILALNAAVEAARAGVAGLGFAVVADEVRNLAQRSAESAKETADKIEAAIAKTALGVQISDKVAQTLNDIVTKVRQVDELVTEVASASREQTQGISQINSAVVEMDKVTQSNAATAEESAAASQELTAQAETMKESVGELLKLAGGEIEAPAMDTPAAAPRVPKSPAAAPAAKRSAPNRLNGHANGNGATPTNGHSNGHSKPATAISLSGNGRSEIPMDDDFKDF
jgi:methyl-accepting chemotaxis protein